MKIRHLLLGLLAVAAAVACEPEVEVTPVLDVDKDAVALEATAAEATFAVTSNQAWTATADQDWVTLEPASGEGSDKAVTVKVTAEDNTAEEARTATVTVSTGDLKKTVAVSQAAAEGGETPGPEPTPEVDWTSEAVVSYDLPEGASEKRQVLRNVKYLVDENYLHVKLQAALPMLTDLATEYLGFFVYDVTNGTGDGYYGWYNGAAGNNEYEGEHIGILTGTDLALTVNETEVPVEKEEAEDNVVWTFSIPRTAHENLQADHFNFAFFTYVGWEPNGALPDKYGQMFAYGEAPVAPEPECTLDGKQWVVETEESAVLLDFGITEEEMLVVAIPSMDGEAFTLYMAGLYEITPTDAASGVITFTQYDWEWDEFADPVEIVYSELGENGVKIAWEGVFGDTEPVPFTLVEEEYEIVTGGGSGEGPAGPIENGEYWFINGEKVMAPLAEDATTGVLPAGNAINGASTEKNIFTLTYDPDWSYYTIQDSYGRYLGQTDETGNITVTDVLPTDDTYAFYLWCVEPGYGEACSIYNAAYYYDITYSATDNNWVLVDGGYEYPETLPVLVKAENPVEEPAPFEPEPSGYFVKGGFNNWGDTTPLMTIEGEETLFVAKNVAVAKEQFKIYKNDGSEWSGIDGQDKHIAENKYYTLVKGGGENVNTLMNGTFDIYFDSSNYRVAFMTSGKPYSEAVEGTPVTVVPNLKDHTWSVAGSLNGVDCWSNNNVEMTVEGDYAVAKNVTLAANDEFKFRADNAWTLSYGTGSDVNVGQTYTTYQNGGNMKFVGEAGAYDIYFSLLDASFYMEESEVVEPEVPAGPKEVTVAEFLEATEDDTVYELTGTISRIQTAYSSQFENISFYLKDATGEVLIYRMDCTDVADPTSLTVGDEITVQGVRSAYNGAAQMGSGSKYVQHVDKEAPVVGAQKVTVAEFVAAAEDDTLYELTGTISSIKTAYSSQYGNISFFLKDATGEVQIYRMDCTGVADPTSLTVGDEITVQGYRSSYNGAAQMGQGGKYVSHVDQAEPEPEPTPEGVVVFDYTSVSTSDQSYTGETVDGVTLTGYRIATNQSGQLRIYKPSNGDNAYIILNSGDKKMTKIELTFVSDQYVGQIEAEGYSNGVWTGNASEVKLVNTGGAEQARITKITITLE